MLARITVSPTSRDSRARLRSRSGSTVAGGNWMLARITVSPTSRDSTSRPQRDHGVQSAYGIYHGSAPALKHQSTPELQPARWCISQVKNYNLGRMVNQTTAGQFWTPAGITDCPTGRSLAHAHKLFMCCSAAVRRPNHMDSSSERLPAMNTRNPRAKSKSNCIAETRRELRRRELRRRELRRRERDGESRGGESLGGESLGGES